MRRNMISAAVVALMTVACVADAFAAKPKGSRRAKAAVEAVEEVVAVAPDSTTLAAATVMGAMMRQQMDGYNNMGVAYDPGKFCEIFTTAFMGGNTGLSVEDADAYMVALFNKAADARTAEAEAAQKTFLDAAAALPGAKVMPSGLVVVTVTPGAGETPAETDRVKVKYEGFLADGTRFDGSDGQDVEFGVSGLIPGFTEGLLNMQTGGTYELYIPFNLGYGARGAGGVIPPNAPLKFVVTLDEIVK